MIEVYFKSRFPSEKKMEEYLRTKADAGYNITTLYRSSEVLQVWNKETKSFSIKKQAKDLKEDDIILFQRIVKETNKKSCRLAKPFPRKVYMLMQRPELSKFDCLTGNKTYNDSMTKLTRTSSKGMQLAFI